MKPTYSDKVGLRGIPRGGSVVASLLKYHDPENLFIVDAAKDMAFQIIIDDIYDTGKTYRDVRQIRAMRDTWFVTMLYRCTPASNSFENMSTHKFDAAMLWTTDEYLVFPWEYDDARLKLYNSEEPKERK